MVVHVFAQDLDLGIRPVVRLAGALDLRDEAAYGLVFDLGFIKQVGVLDGSTYGGIEDFLLDLGMDREFLADALRQIQLLLGSAARARPRELLVFLEHLLDGAVIGIEQVAGILT